jgi:hypothetical protein
MPHGFKKLPKPAPLFLQPFDFVALHPQGSETRHYSSFSGCSGYPRVFRSILPIMHPEKGAKCNSGEF